jgi:ParB family transcriptional regulator, chromosome partitioning protein
MALGKGLENILGDYFGNETVVLNDVRNTQKVLEISVKDIQDNPHQTRKHFDSEKIKSLASSIKRSGLLNPITVLEESPGSYVLLAGERRLRAYKELGLENIPALVRNNSNLSDNDKFVISAAENLHRENLNAMELAKTFEILLLKQGITKKRLSTELGSSEQYVQNYLNLLRLYPAAQEAVATGKIGEGIARQLVTWDEETQEKLLQVIIEKNLSVRQLVSHIKRTFNTSSRKEVSWVHNIPQKYYSQAEKLAGQFKGAKIKAKGNEEKGRLIIYWGE